jgi:hypothetical protein
MERTSTYPGTVNGIAARYINYGILFDSRDGRADGALKTSIAAASLFERKL